MHRSRLRFSLAFVGYLTGAIVFGELAYIRGTSRFFPAYEMKLVKAVNSAIGGGWQGSSEDRAALTQAFSTHSQAEGGWLSLFLVGFIAVCVGLWFVSFVVEP